MTLLRTLRAARWLTTGQVRRRFFPRASVDAARKRLRKLARAGYLLKIQERRTNEALFTVGREGKRVLEKGDRGEIALERKPPRNLEHMLGINDLRVAVEVEQSVSYFFACWELSSIGWNASIIPDAVFRIRDTTCAAEFDRGVEGIQFFVRTKMTAYHHPFTSLQLTALIVVTDRRARMDSLARAITSDKLRVLLCTIDRIREHGILAPIFYEPPNKEGVRLL